MKLVTYEKGWNEFVGIWAEEKGVVIPLPYATMITAIYESTPEDLARFNAEAKNAIPVEKVRFKAPIPYPMRDIICLGINYRSHSDEIAHSFGKEQLKKRSVPIYFSKKADTCVDPDGIIDGHFDICDSLDYEAELAVIIGKRCYKVSEEEAEQYVFGYTICNDVSARNIQTNYKQWYFGKSLDRFCPMGPCIVTRNTFAYPPQLRISCTVNGELRQDSNTKLLVHGISHIISELSQGMTLYAGTIISTGTPGGVGMGMQPPCFLKKGDKVTCSIEGIGDLTNTVGGYEG